MYQRYTELQSFIRREHFKVWGEWVRTPKEGLACVQDARSQTGQPWTLLNFFHILFIMLGTWGAKVCLCHGTCVAGHVDRATHVRTTFKSHFFPSTMWVSGKKLKSLGFAASKRPYLLRHLAGLLVDFKAVVS